MMVLPLLIIVLLPKVVNTNDPEMRKASGCCLLCCLEHNCHCYIVLYEHSIHHDSI